MWKVENACGVSVGRLSEEEKESGGVWLIGDTLPKGHPGRVLRDPLYKTWVGVASKYGAARGGHVVDTTGPYGGRQRPHGGRREFVQVMDGRFLCHPSCHHTSESLTFPNCIDLPPEVRRTWTSVDGEDPARGITVCRYDENGIGRPLGTDFVFSVFDLARGNEDNENPLKTLSAVRGFPWYCMVEVFKGLLGWQFGTDKHVIGEGEHIFFPAERKIDWRLDSSLRGAIVLFKPAQAL